MDKATPEQVDRAEYIAQVILMSPSMDAHFLGGWIDAALEEVCEDCGALPGEKHHEREHNV